MSEDKIEEVINSVGCVCIKTVGTSMNPFIISGKDTVCITKLKDKLEKYDVVLFKRGDKLVLHRIAKVNEQSYDIVGDNQIKRELNVLRQSILGVLSGYYKYNGKYVDCNSKSFKFWSRVWNFLPIKICGVLFIRLKNKIAKMIIKTNNKNNL